MGWNFNDIESLFVSKVYLIWCQLMDTFYAIPLVDHPSGLKAQGLALLLVSYSTLIAGFCVYVVIMIAINPRPWSLVVLVTAILSIHVNTLQVLGVYQQCMATFRLTHEYITKNSKDKKKIK
ncbi:hypothetical protein M422DRAFT_43608 [Sphaerobolus stellatus SS14]|nr:hypothetical protein M422DRAFT_43608 [Sphaerobolus stellatus SS14]